MMKSIILRVAVVVALAVCSVGSSAKVFDVRHYPRKANELRNGDNFSVECRDRRTGVIDRESVDVDAATVTVEMPGSEPIVHHITQFSINGGPVQDRFGQLGLELHVVVAEWGQIGAIGVGLILSGDRWVSHHEDDTWWTCAD